MLGAVPAAPRGVGLGDGLVLLAEESDGRGRELLEAMARQVDEGSALSAAMKETGRFPAYVCGLIEVGEAAGRTRPCPLCPGTTRTGCGWTAACPRCGC